MDQKADDITSNFLKAVFTKILLGPFLNTLSEIAMPSDLVKKLYFLII